jgi:hypothetical protein
MRRDGKYSTIILTSRYQRRNRSRRIYSTRNHKNGRWFFGWHRS